MSVANLLLTLLVVQIVWTLLVRWSVKKITCHRKFSRPTAFEGESGELVEVVRNDGPVVIPWLRVESVIPRGLRLGRQNIVELTDGAFYRSCFTTMPYQQVRRRHYVKFLRRGAYELGNANLVMGDLLGWTRFSKEQQISCPVTVYPRIPDTDELPFPLSDMLGQLAMKRQLLSDPFLVRGIREYQPGDLIRDIHWSATARTQEMQVKVHDNTISPRLLVVINAQGSDDQWDNYVRSEFEQLLEEEIRLAAAMCVYGLRAGLAVGMAANMPLERKGQSTVILPKEGIAWEETLLDSYARLQCHCSEMFVTFLDSLQTCHDMDILVISPYDSDSVQKGLEKLRSQGNQVTFYQMEGGDR